MFSAVPAFGGTETKDAAQTRRGSFELNQPDGILAT
jgi:hypothetical protein